MKPLLKRLNERGEALPAAIVTALVSAMVLLGAAGMVSYIVQGKGNAEKATLAETTFASIESQFKTDLTKASKVQPISSTEFMIHTVFQNPANAAQNHCKLINWKVSGNKLERAITFYKGTNPTDVTDCTNSDTMIVSKGTKTLTHKLDAVDTTFNFQNGLGRELSVVGGAVGFKNPNSCPLNDEMPASDPECGAVEYSVQRSWNQAKAEKVDYVLSINSKTRSLSQAPTLGLYTNVNPEGSELSDTAVGDVASTVLRAPDHAFVNVPFNVSWDAVTCPADTVRSYTLLRDGVAVLTTADEFADTSVPNADADAVTYSVLVNCARGDLLVNSIPSNVESVNVGIAPPRFVLNDLGNNVPVSANLTSNADACVFGVPSWSVERAFDSYQALSSASTVTGSGRVNMRLNERAPAFEGTDYQLRVTGTCDDAASGKKSASANVETPRFLTVFNVPEVTSIGFGKVAYGVSELASVRLNVTVTTCPASWVTSLNDTWGRVNLDDSHTMWTANVRNLGDTSGVTRSAEYQHAIPAAEPANGKGVTAKVSSLTCSRGNSVVSSVKLGGEAAASYVVPAPAAPILNPPALLSVDAGTGSLSWSAVTCSAGFSPRYEVVRTRTNGVASDEIVRAAAASRTATVDAPGVMRSHEFRVDASCVSAAGVSSAKTPSNLEELRAEPPVMTFSMNCPVDTNLFVPASQFLNGSITWEFNGSKVTKGASAGMPNPSQRVPANTPVKVTVSGVVSNGSVNAGAAVPDASKACVQSMDRWDAAMGYTSGNSAFSYYPNLTHIAKPPANITDFRSMFAFSPKFNQDVSSWVDPARQYQVAFMFRYADSFNNGKAPGVGGDLWPGFVAKDGRWAFENARAFNQKMPNWKLVGDNSYLVGGTKFNNGAAPGTSAVPLTWDTAELTNAAGMFRINDGFNQPLGAKFDTGNVTDMSGMFFQSYVYNQPFPAKFTTSKVTDMGRMFTYARAFNQSLAQFDTSSVTNMQDMFHWADAFNSSLGANFDTSKVTNMESMFDYAPKFNQPLGSKFDTSNVTNMWQMFNGATVFNQSLGAKFNTAKVTDMRNMFNGAKAFNQTLGSLFDTGNVTDMYGMFHGATVFNQPLGAKFNTAKVTGMGTMFASSAYDQPFPAAFTTANVTNMWGMFHDAKFNQLLGANFDTSKVTDMSHMFDGATFNQVLGVKFDTSNVTDMSYMFARGHFNQPLGTKFNTSKVKNFDRFVLQAKAFNQDLSKLSTVSAETHEEYRKSSPLDVLSAKPKWLKVGGASI